MPRDGGVGFIRGVVTAKSDNYGVKKTTPIGVVSVFSDEWRSPKSTYAAKKAERRQLDVSRRKANGRARRDFAFSTFSNLPACRTFFFLHCAAAA